MGTHSAIKLRNVGTFTILIQQFKIMLRGICITTFHSLQKPVLDKQATQRTLVKIIEPMPLQQVKRFDN